MSGLKQRINDEVKSAMRSHNKERVGVLRVIMAALKQKEVDERIELDDTQVLTVLDKLAKQHRDSIAQFQGAGREDLVKKETGELQVVLEFMPAPLSDAEIEQYIRESISATGAADAKDMGKVMAQLKARVQGRADMGKVSGLVKKLLS